MNKKIILILIVVFILCGCFYYKSVNETEKEETTYTCEENYICETIENKEYKWTRKTKEELTNIYNYDTDKNENGSLQINDGVLEFINTDNNIVKTYNEIKDKILYMEKSIHTCNELPIYIVLTEKGKLYQNYLQVGLLVEEPFIEIETEHKVKEFMINYNITDSKCMNFEIIIKTEKGNIEKILLHEN